MLNKDQKRLLQDLLCICAEVLKEYADCTEEKAPQDTIIHGVSCAKHSHDGLPWGTGCSWSHSENLDGPYLFADGRWFCGRCHSGLRPEQVCEMVRRQARSKGGEHA